MNTALLALDPGPAPPPATAERDATDRALREREELFRTMADTMPHIAWITDADGSTLFFNRQWTRYTGEPYSPPDAARIAAAHVHPDDAAITMQRFEEARARGYGFSVEHRIRAASGEYHWFQVQAEPYRDPDSGTILRWVGTSVDIHDRREADRVLRETAAGQALRLRVDDAIRTLGSADDIIRVASEMLGRHLGAIRVMYGERTGPDSVRVRSEWTAPGHAAIEGTTLTLSDFGAGLIEDLCAGREVVNDDVRLDPRTAAHADAFALRGVRSEIVVPVVRAGELRLVVAIHKGEPHRWQAGEIELARTVAHKILLAAEAAGAQVELHAERDLSHAIFESMDEGLVLFGHDWTVEWVNAAGVRLAQRPREALLGRNHWDVLPETAGGPLEALYRHVRETGESRTLEYRHVPADGVPRWLEVRPYRLEDGRLVVLFRDVDERKRMEQALNEAVQRRDEFLAMLGHELRNPLAPIRAAADLLALQPGDAERVRRTSAVISRQVQHMTGLVDDLLDVSRVTRGLAVLDRTAVDLKRIVADAVEQVRPLMEARRHRLSVHLPPEPAGTTGDAKRLVQVLTNLLNNAAKFTPEGGHVELSMQVLDAQVEIVVRDDGIGMSPEMVARAFTLFSQAERTSDRAQGGLGIGLALVRSLVELHGGTVSASSAGPDSGSTFTVWLPRSGRDDGHGPDASTHAADAAPVTDPARPLRVLVVDDNVDAAAMLQLLLETCGHVAVTEHDSRRGLARARAERPDVCLLDIGLPDMDGNALARALRADPATRDAVLVAVTGYGQASDRDVALAAGFDHYLTKPLELATLTDLLDAVQRR